MPSYTGDVEVVVRMRYTLGGVLELNKQDKPKKSELLKALRSGKNVDIYDEERLEVIEVVTVGKNVDHDPYLESMDE